MDTKWIEDFMSLAQTRSFSRSATERGMTQSALSKRIRALEQWVGADLVDRSGFPMALTPAGALFCATATDAMKLLNDARALLRKEDAGRDVLRIAAGHTLALAFVPRWLQSAGAPGPVHAHIKAANVHDSVLALNEGNCDLLVCYHHDDLPVLVDRDQFDCVTIGSDVLIPVSVAARSGQPAFALPGSKSFPVPLLAYGQHSYFGRVVEYLMGRAGPCAITRTSESDMAEVLKALALAGQGLAWLPASCIETELAEGRLVHAGGQAWRFGMRIIIVRARANRAPALAALWAKLTAPAGAVPMEPKAAQASADGIPGAVRPG
ncbi:MAG: LysR substrate-binding domain-containing protein [Pseudomonadota bacterium]